MASENTKIDNPISEELIALKRAYVESIYTGRMNIYMNAQLTDSKTGITRFSSLKRITNEPCRLTGQSSGTTSPNDTSAPYSKTISLMCAPELNIPPGSIIEVTFNGKTNRYKQSGEKRLYSDHQTINLELVERLA